ncbi:MAG TPA: hypothetical protein VGN57_18990 [Pirellulaceae bacterium]|nr:hypothetical protein [Pirellulaceae bacterium]
MLHAFRTIEIPLELKDGVVQVRVPFTVALLQQVEETLMRCAELQWAWFRVRRSDKTVLHAYQDFCRPYFPADFDYEQADPTLFALFFSHVRAEFLRSINACNSSTSSTEMSDLSTEERTTEGTASPSSTD